MKDYYGKEITMMDRCDGHVMFSGYTPTNIKSLTCVTDDRPERLILLSTKMHQPIIL